MHELEYVLKKIVEIDHKVSDLQSSAQKKIDDKETEVLQKISYYDEKLMENTRNKLEEKYQLSLERAHNQAQIIKEDTDKHCEETLNLYHKIKNHLKEEILDELIRS